MDWVGSLQNSSWNDIMKQHKVRQEYASGVLIWELSLPLSHLIALDCQCGRNGAVFPHYFTHDHLLGSYWSFKNRKSKIMNKKGSFSLPSSYFKSIKHKTGEFRDNFLDMTRQALWLAELLRKFFCSHCLLFLWGYLCNHFNPILLNSRHLLL